MLVFITESGHRISRRTEQFDLPYTESTVSTEINGIMGTHLEGRSQYMRPLSKEGMSHYQFIFIMYRKPDSAKDVKSVSRASEAFSYFVHTGCKKLLRKTEVNLLSKLDVIQPIFRYAADVVLMNRDSTMLKA
ncbi:hypothetical protein Aduo_015582 [Ancylostoma duodenale]